MATHSPNIGGFCPFTTIDFPGKLACVVFIQGCPWRCSYCHNKQLQPRQNSKILNWAYVRDFLKKRKGLLDGIVFSGGEPTLDPALAHAMQQAHALGFAVGLHTAGIYPQQLASLLPWVNWVGLDIKASWANYDAITGIKNSAHRAQESLALLLEHEHIQLECRTTIHPHLHDEHELHRLINTLSHDYGIQNFAFQLFRATGCSNNTLNKGSLHHYPSPSIIQYAKLKFAKFSLRNG